MGKIHFSRLFDKKAGFTVVEGLMSMLLVSMIAVGAVMFVGYYNRNVQLRDEQIAAFTKNINTIERLRNEVGTVGQLIDFINANDVKVYAVGFGEVAVTDNSLHISNPEGYGFNPGLTSAVPRIFRIQAGGDPNSRITTIIVVGG